MSTSRVRAVFAFVVLLLVAPTLRAQVTYQVDGFTTGSYNGFNNSQGTETEDNFVANSFQVVAGGTRLQSFTLILGTGLTNRPASLVVYRGSSLTNPQAGTGLTRIHTTNTTVTTTVNSLVTMNLSAPVDLAVGDIFYAAVLLPGNAGSVFPWGGDIAPPAPAGRSFFDVGATQGAAYNLDVTTRMTVLGGTHPVVGAGVQNAGNLILRVNAVAVPEPGSLGLIGVGLLALARRRRH